MTTEIVVIGAGFAGLAAARRLAAADARGQVRVTVVDRNNHHTFAPLLYQVATAGMHPQDVARGLRSILGRHPNVQVRLGSVTDIDADGRQVRLDDGTALAYDHLVLAAGAVIHDHGIPGVTAHALPLKDLGDAVALRNHVLDQFEVVSARPEQAGEAALTIVVAGGGPTGVELAGALVELTDALLRRDYPDLRGRAVPIVLVEPRHTLLPPFSKASRHYTIETLRDRGVELRLGTGIARVDPDRVQLDDGSVIATRTVVWTAGVRGNPIGAALDAPLTPGGRIVVEPDLRVRGRSDLWVVGDLAAFTGPDGRLVPQLAPVAMQQGRHAAAQILRVGRGAPSEPFVYRDKGIMATIGRNAAVAELPGGLRLRGFPAWVAWLALHLLYLVGFRNRVSALLAWSWSYLTYDRALRVVFTPARSNGSPPDHRRAA